MINQLLIALAAGCVGAIGVNALNLIFGFLNIPPMIGIDLSPDLNLIDLLSDLFWGSCWGLLFLMPVLSSLPIVKGLIIGIFSFLFQLFIAFSYLHLLPLGQTVTLYSPVLLLLYLLFLNLVWGVIAGYTWKAFKDGLTIV